MKEKAMKSATNYFRNALLAAQYPVIEYKDKVFETITWAEISKGCLTPENAKRFWDAQKECCYCVENRFDRIRRWRNGYQ